MGFFNRDELEELTTKPHAKPGKKRPLTCEGCGLYKGVRSPKMKPSGDGKAGILVLAEAPGEDEDKTGTQLVGKVGQYLERKCSKMGINLHKDCRKINALACRPPDNREPEDFEIDCCRARVWDEIHSFKPKIILIMGKAAIKSFLDHRWAEGLGSIGRWSGWKIPDREAGCWVLPMNHPSYARRMQGLASEKIFERDLSEAISYLDVPFPEYLDGEEQMVRILREGDAKDYLRKLYREKPRMAFDFETTGKKPHREGHRIVCCSISTSEDSSEVFMMTDPLARLLRKIMGDKEIEKINQHLQFENLWSSVCLRQPVEGVIWDTMLASHVLDNRPGVTGLKFQSYAQLGKIYGDDMRPFLEFSNDGTANGFNRITEARERDLLLYCGIDGIETYRLAQIQMEALGYGHTN